MRQVHFGNYWESSDNYAYVKGTRILVDKSSFIDDLNYLRCNKECFYHSHSNLIFIKEDGVYSLIDATCNCNRIMSSESLDQNEWLEEIPDEDFDKYEHLFFE